ncbi:MAG: ATP-binding protein [Oscillospiraceae bacterium]|nr:ATP-binding protein [Oscillospiraceae bacterium]
MAYDPNVFRRANARLEARRAERSAALKERREEIYAALPRVQDIDRQLQETVRQAIVSALRQGTDPAPAIAVLRDRNLSLQRERDSLLSAHGYAAGGLDETPFCPRCADSGWRGTSMCSCLKRLCQEEQIKELTSLLGLKNQSFDTFDLDCYSSLPWPGQPLPPRENMELVRDTCYHYAARFRHTEIRNLFFHGAPGLGKTFLSACIAKEVSEQGFSVVYDTASNVFAQFEARKFDRDPDAAGDTRRYLSCDLLLLDDLGTEMTTPFVQSALYSLINARLVDDRCTVVSSNLSMEQVRQRYSAQVASRLEGEYHSMFFYGDDIRLQKKRRF